MNEQPSRKPGRPVGSVSPDPGASRSFHCSGPCLRLFDALLGETGMSKGQMVFEAIKLLAPTHLTPEQIAEAMRVPSPETQSEEE